MKAAVFSCVAGFAVASPSHDIQVKFEEFRTKWGRTYVGEEYVRRLKFFENHMQQVENLQRQEEGTAIYTHLGPFADLSPEEMAQRFGLLPLGGLEQIPTAPLLNESMSDSFDWVAKGAVNPVKDQGQCGSCWSFSTVCNLEGTGFVTAGKLVSLSEQNIMDCDKTCYSCNGGLPSLALTWSSQNGGVAAEALYPYKASDEACRVAGKLTSNKGYVKVSQNEDQIAQALVHYGPLSIGVDATPFQSYHGGVMKNPSCSKTRLDHAVNIVGYGNDLVAGVKYWKIRNSWSANWGEAGYIRVSRGHDTCGLASTVVTATGVTVRDHPTPTPPPTPAPCVDELPVCFTWECHLLGQECRKTCKLCDDYSGEVSLTSTGIFDDIKKLICEALESGMPSHEIDVYICEKMKYSLEVTACEEVVKIVVSKIESGVLDCTATQSSVVV